jgi:hypothetical protein
MEISRVETEVLSEALAEVVQGQVRELNELQLALVGGGSGEVIFG